MARLVGACLLAVLLTQATIGGVFAQLDPAPLPGELQRPEKQPSSTDGLASACQLNAYGEYARKIPACIFDPNPSKCEQAAWKVYCAAYEACADGYERGDGERLP